MHVRRINGFTLIELVVGIIVFSIVLVIITTLVAPQARRSVEPILQVRATELAQSLLNEITAKSFDEVSDRTGGMVRCGEDLSEPPNGTADDSDIGELGDCTAAANLGPEESARADFDDVDDYITDAQLCDDQILNSQGLPISINGRNLYQGFCIFIVVSYYNDTDEDSQKLIEVTVTTPTDQQLVFSAIRANY